MVNYPIQYKLEPIEFISREEFYDLINSNKTYIQKGFAGTVKCCNTREASKNVLKEWISNESQGKCYTFFIKNSSHDIFIGLINIKSIDHTVKKCELGYFIAESYSGKGLVSKFTSDVVTYCFNVLQMNKIYLRIAPDNIGSQKVAINNGFTQEGILREEYKGFQDKLEDVVYFGLLKSEYSKK
ncbi:GNAT family protein [uncultured Algibacter sp.]|uniref:GNAT family N-acetyltransferase n=1 Tax=uncultured Algibacter sp. TaxID=298659 RepID=UPI003216F18C